MEEKILLQGDVLIAGGTLEGCILALELSKAKKKVILTERRGSFGGAATNGICCSLFTDQVSEEGKPYAKALMAECSEKEGINGPLFLEQKCKVWLGRELQKAGVKILTHVFPYACSVREDSVSSVLEGKTGTVEIDTEYAVDADSEHLLLRLAGIPSEVVSKKLYGSIKWTDIREETVRGFTGETLFDAGDCLIRKINIGYVPNGKKSVIGAEDVICLYNRRYHETVLNGISVIPETMDEFGISGAYAGLRTYSYKLRDMIRGMENGSPKAAIIFVSPVLDQYGVRRFHTEGGRLLHIPMEHYTNEEAITLAVKMADEILNG